MICGKCKKDKSKEEFSLGNLNVRYKSNCICRECISEKNKKYSKYISHPIIPKYTLDEIQCNKCKEIKSRDEYFPSFLRDSTYICKSCSYKKQVDYIARTYIRHPKVKFTEDGKLICRKCKKPKELKEFHKCTAINKSGYVKSRIGYQNICKDCVNKISKDYYNKNKSYYLDKSYRRSKNMRFIQLMDNPFPKEIKVEFHHIDNIFTIPIPKITHRNNFKRKRDLHRVSMEKVIYNLYGLNVKCLIDGDWE